MNISVVDLFKVGIGPSSSHTVGPMKAAARFVDTLEKEAVLPKVSRVSVDLFGSLGATGRGHQSDKAVLLGLSGLAPESVDVDEIPALLEVIRSTKTIRLGGVRPIQFEESRDLLFRRKSLPFHPNGIVFTAFAQEGETLSCKTYYSIGGGFILEEPISAAEALQENVFPIPYPFSSGEDLLTWCDSRKISISQLMLANETARRPESVVKEELWNIWKVMERCIERGFENRGYLPGDLSVKRRAPDLYQKLSETEDSADPLQIMDWVNLFALAVNEENAAGGRVVTAPTNGAAGIIPAVLMYWVKFGAAPGSLNIKETVVRFLLTAGAIGALYKKNASISGAELGCQGEVGVACSMAAGALAELKGGTPWQVENAAEIGMEHNLGLTCDPVGGLVQIPCIERNAMGAVKAINAARMALRGDGYHTVSLDKVIKTMRETGRDMKIKYKETSRGGLAVNVIEC